MSRQTGIFGFTKNFEVLNAAPLDARMRVPFFSGLTDSESIPYPYNGMLVSVISDNIPARNGLYILKDKGTATTAATTASIWEVVGGTSITGGTLNLTGGTIDFSGATTGFTVNNIDFVTGFTVTNNAISGYSNTNDPYGGIITAVTGATYDATGRTLSLSGTGLLSTGVQVTQQFDYYGLDSLFLNPTNFILSATTKGGVVVTANTTPLSVDNYVTGGTYSASTGKVEFRSVSGTPFEVGGWPTNLANYYTTASTYTQSTGIITFDRTDTQSAYSATGFNYITGFTVYSNNTLSGVTNTGQTINGGTLNAVTGGSFSNGTLLLSGTGTILSGITGFGTGSAVVTGGTDSFITKWSGTSALTISQIYDNGTNVGVGITGAGLTNKLTVSASTDPVKLIGVQQSTSPIPSTKFLAWDNSTGVVSWNNVTPQTGITIYVTGFTSNFLANGLNPVVDFIPSGTTDNYRGVSYQYLITANSFPTTRMGTLQGLWTSGASPYVSYSDVGPTQITDGSNTIINSIYLSAVTGGIRVVVDCGGGDYTFKAYKVLL